MPPKVSAEASEPSVFCTAVAATVTATGTTIEVEPFLATSEPSYMPKGASLGTLMVALNAPPDGWVSVTHGQSTFL